MPRTSDETRRLFDRWAATYDQDAHQPDGPLAGYDSSLRAAAELIEIEPGAQVLDVGVGTGAFAALVAAHGAHITGIDPSEKMLEQCCQQHPDYVLETGSFNSIPFADSRFDSLISSFAFHEVLPDERPAACRDMARVLRPGGPVCLLDIMFASPAAMREAEWRIGRYWDPEEVYALVGDLDTMLRAAGFAALRWQQTAPCHWAVCGRRNEN